MALMQITVIPIGTGSPGVSDYIADIEIFLRKKGIEHSLNDMGTVIAGPMKELLDIAHDIHRIPLEKGSPRVVTHITLDERVDLERKIDEKQQSVLQKLAERKKT